MDQARRLTQLRWAPKISRHKLKKLYENDALGIVDDELIEEIGFSLWARCHSIVQVSENKRLDCPQCNTEIVCPAPRWSREHPILCPVCGWKATYGQYRDSWRNQDLAGGTNALPFYKAFLEEFPRAKTARERLLLIDQLIHTFHWSARHQRNHVPVGRQLIEGGLEKVIAFLDGLSYGDQSSPELKETLKEWKRSLEKLAGNFSFIREKMPLRQKGDEDSTRDT